MSSLANVTIHNSQFPESVYRELLESFITRQLNHKFLYDGARQSQKWLAVQKAHSPWATDADCAETYHHAYVAATQQVRHGRVHVIGLGCGNGKKDARLINLLRSSGREVFYTPCDVSTAMVLVARQTVLETIPDDNCTPLVCDLTTAQDLPEVLHSRVTDCESRIVTFFGMIPNFEPRLVLPRLAALIQQSDLLLLSANLVPCTDYAAGMKEILPQYDNPITREWLLSFLLDLGVEPEDGALRFTIEDGVEGLKRVVARFHYQRTSELRIDNERFVFAAGDSIRLFFSYRYTPDRLQQLLGQHNIILLGQWVTKSGEEGVFICQRGYQRGNTFSVC